MESAASATLRRYPVTKKPPPDGLKVPSGIHAMRRGGARREVTERVMLKAETEDGSESPLLEGWALNVSRGGVRAILEDKVALGQKFDITIGTDDVMTRTGRVVWVQEEPDGVIVGLEFTSLSGTHKSVPPMSPEGEDAGADVPPDPQRE